MIQESVQLDGQDTPYLYGVDCAPELTEALLRRLGETDTVVFVVDRNVRRQAEPVVRRLAEHLPVTVFAIEAGDQRKTLSLLEQLVEHAIGHGASRNSAVVAMGGGMVGNVAGLASALLFRGIRLFHLPTTPIAAFDSVLSVKQAVNLRGGKNLCGTYHRPSLIACDLSWLAGAPPEQLLTGLAEMVKNVLAVVPELEGELVEAIGELDLDPGAALLKLLRVGRVAKEGFLRADPRERRQALVFEYGHTMGHALEFTSRGEIGHGEAVGWGMLVAAEVSHGLGHLSAEDVERHYRLLSHLRLPELRSRLERIDVRQLRAVLCRDNKRGYLHCEPDQISMVLLESLGKHLTGPEGYPLINVRAQDAMRALDRVVEALDRRWVAASV